MEIILENLIIMMLAINIIGFLYRLNCHLSIQYINIYPLLFILYREIYFIIAVLIILYLIIKMIQIHDELIMIKETLIQLKQIEKNNV
jgi:hypothetical protein